MATASSGVHLKHVTGSNIFITLQCHGVTLHTGHQTIFFQRSMVITVGWFLCHNRNNSQYVLHLTS